MNRRPSFANARTPVAAAVLCLAALLAPAGVVAAAAGATTEFPGVVDINTNLRFQNASAAGTGIVLTAAGEILTNNHVIRGATTIRVTDPATGHSYAATVVGYARTADVAVLRLKNASHLATVTLGRSSAVKVGQSVTAVGNARGAGGTPAATTGKVTALGRPISAGEADGTSERLTGLIQIDAALEPGDSGGPLFDSGKHVIGMDTAASAGFAFESGGEGFAIPIDRAMSVVRQIEAGRTIGDGARGADRLPRHQRRRGGLGERRRRGGGGGRLRLSGRQGRHRRRRRRHLARRPKDRLPHDARRPAPAALTGHAGAARLDRPDRRRAQRDRPSRRRAAPVAQ